MTSPGDVINEAVPALVRLTDRPGAALLRVAGLGVAAFAALGLIFAQTGPRPGALLPLVLAAVLALPVGLLALRRWRLQAFTADLSRHPTVTPEAGAVDTYAAGSPAASRQDPLGDAIVEGRIRTARFMPRVEAAQRAAIAAAGGTVNAPYLRDDFRVTLIALLGTLAAVPLSTLGSIVTAIVLLSS